ncbi:MAG: Asp-tRNA(Asn)/Glu-tRNA(Gln) amidotransferase subunit GatC [Patescibacteria group bacterium]
MTKKHVVLDEKQVEHIAKLANLTLSEKETVHLSCELSSVLDYIKQLEEVDTKTIKPTFQTSNNTNVFLNEKIGGRSLSVGDALLDAKEKTKNLFIIPSMKYEK